MIAGNSFSQENSKGCFMEMKKQRILLILLLLLFLLNGCASGKPDTFSFAVEINVHPACAYIAYAEGDFFRKNIQVSSFNQFETGPALAAALTRGDVNAALLCVQPAITAFAQGVPIKIVCLTHVHGNGLVVRPEISRVRDLDGSIVGCMGEGSSSDFLLRLVEEQYSLHFQVRRMNPLAIITALEQGSLNAAFLPEPYVTLLARKGFTRILEAEDVFPHLPGSCLVVREEVLKEDEDSVKNLVAILEERTSWIQNHLEEAAQILSQPAYLNIDPAILAEAMTHLSYTNEIDRERLQEVIDKMAEWGYIRRFKVEEILWQGN